MTFLFDTTYSCQDNIHVPLTELVLQALSPRAYTAAASSISAFEKWLSSLTALRQGVVYTAPSLTLYCEGATGNGDHSAREHLQFVIKSTAPTMHGYVLNGTTRVYVVPPQHDTDPEAMDVQAGVTEFDTYEIDEGFLENGALSLPSDLRVCSTSFELASLSSPISQVHDDYTVYVRTYDLGRLGILNGDWAVIRADAKKTCRMVRVQANDITPFLPNIVYASPNLRYGIVEDLIGARVRIYPTPFGSGHPAVPIARTVTIARLATALSVDRTYQSLFLHKLHDHFCERSRFMKQGDLIAVPIDTDDLQWTSQSDESHDASTGTDTADIQRSMAVASTYPNEIAYFMVTNIECDALPSQMSVDDLDAGITTGEWGCWVDPSVTRIVQTGVEHARVPDVAGYLGLDETRPAPQNVVYHKLVSLVAAALTRNAIDYRLQLSVVLKGAKGTGKLTTTRSVSRQLGLHILELNCYDLVGENDTQTEGLLRARFEKAASCSPCLFVIRHIDALSQSTQSSEAGRVLPMADVLTECIDALQQAWSLTAFPVIVIATTDRPEETSPSIMACFKHEFNFDAPEEEERHLIFRSLTRNTVLAPDVSLKDFAVQTAALVASDMVDLVSRGKHACMKRAMQDSGCDAFSLHKAGTILNSSDLEIALNKARISYAESIGAPKIPNVSWDDVGGLASVKADILDTIQLPLEHPELFSHGLKKRSGILLYGPPGTGKTLLAKAVATSCALNFFSVKGPELLNMYIGESEANVRRVFQRARDAKPCVIFFDELDSVAPKRGAHGDSGGVMDRIVSQLLAELDGVAAGESGADVFVIGATNRPDLLDPALLRPGRFDRMLYLGVSQTHEAQLNILQALTRKFKLHPDLSLEIIAEACPFHYTGADFYALCSDALLKAMSRKAEELEAKIVALNAGPVDLRHPHPLTPQYYLAEMASPQEIEVLVSQDDFETALRGLVPSVSQDEMDHYARVQQQFSKETINSVSPSP